MPACVALLRAVNVGGRGAIAMADLRAVATDLGFTAVRTLLQSGNLVFATPDAEGAAARIEKRLAEHCGLTTDVLVRTAAEWSALVAANPFPEVAADDPGHLVADAARRASPPRRPSPRWSRRSKAASASPPPTASSTSTISTASAARS